MATAKRVICVVCGTVASHYCYTVIVVFIVIRYIYVTSAVIYIYIVHIFTLTTHYLIGMCVPITYNKFTRNVNLMM